MTASPPPAAAPSSSGGSAALVWTLCLAAAVVVIATRPKGASAPEPKAARMGARSYNGSEAERMAATQTGRGRAARGPTQITRAGWKDIAVRVYLEFNKDRVLSVAAGVTFYTLLSLFPAIAALVTCYGLVADVGAINEHLASMQGILPASAIDIVGEQVKRIAAKSGGTLGLTFFTTLLISLWSANAAMKAMFDALNVVYEEQEKRSFLMLNLRSLTFTIGALLFTILALGSIVVLPVAFNFLGLSDGVWLLASLRWPGLLVVVLGALSLLYRYGPSRERPRWRWVGVGGAVSGLLWLAASILFSWYVASFGNYNETYGSLGAVIGFMTWIWISTTIVLLGGEINAEMEHQTAHDTTTGPAMPMGRRKAAMADALGAAA